MFYRVNLFALQLFDRPTSRRQIHTELVVDGTRVCDRLGHIEQQLRGSSELQFEFLISLADMAALAPRETLRRVQFYSPYCLPYLIFRRSPNYAT